MMKKEVNSAPSKKKLKSTTELLKISKSQSKSSSKEKINLWNAPNVVEFACEKLGVKLDDWQKDYINCKGNTAVRAGRQSGKSFAESLRAALFALRNEKTLTLIIGAVDRQSVELFEKVKSHIRVLAPNQVKGRPTLHKIELRNGSKIIAEPAGRTGYGLRGYAINKLVVDEAHYVPEEVFVAVRPMLATTNGTMDLLSTPRGNIGFFHDCFEDEELKKDFTQFHTRSEDCPRISPEFLAQERKRMSKLQYKQEYEAEFLDELQQFFSKELIDSCILKENNIANGSIFLGVDLGGHGIDPTAYVNVKNEGDKCYISRIEETEDKEAWKHIKKMEKLLIQFNYNKIGIDSGGIGGPILDYALKHDHLKRKVIGLNNSKREIDRDGKTTKLLKNDMYWNLRLMMEQGLIKFPNHPDLIRSLTSIQIEINPQTLNEIFSGKYSHITEACIRAGWLIKKKGLNIYVY